MPLPMIRHETNRFVMTLVEHEGEATLTYQEVHDGSLVIYNFTDIRGPYWFDTGKTGLLIRAACNIARGEDIKIVPSCSVVADWLVENPDECEGLLAYT